jgi:uncharacterized membrane protein YoaK (UPF0700 family)
VATQRRSWIVVTLVAAVLYIAFGLVFAALAGSAASHQMRVMWRLLAWLISSAVFAAHIWVEHSQPSHTSRSAAWHVCVAVAIGGFGLAVAASIHNERPLASALVMWPLILALPAYVVALLGLAGLKMVRQAHNNDSSQRAA